MDRSEVIAVLDVGGTTIKLGAVRGDDMVVGRPVPAHAQGDAALVLRQLRTAIAAALDCAREMSGASADRVVVAFPGPFDFEAGTPLLRGLHKFDSIHGIDLDHELRAGLGTARPISISFVRDSEAVGVGEAVFGAGRGAHRVLTLALGTGLGACLTIDGAPVFEIGGQVIDRLHELQTPHGRADDVLSARGLASLLEVSPERIGSVLSTGEIDPVHRAAANEFGRRLGSFVSVVSGLGVDVDVAVIAGGLARSFADFGAVARASSGLRCVAAELGDVGPLRGAAHLARAVER